DRLHRRRRRRHPEQEKSGVACGRRNCRGSRTHLPTRQSRSGSHCPKLRTILRVEQRALWAVSRFCMYSPGVVKRRSMGREKKKSVISVVKSGGGAAAHPTAQVRPDRKEV